MSPLPLDARCPSAPYHRTGPGAASGLLSSPALPSGHTSSAAAVPRATGAPPEIGGLSARLGHWQSTTTSALPVARPGYAEETSIYNFATPLRPRVAVGTASLANTPAPTPRPHTARLAGATASPDWRSGWRLHARLAGFGVSVALLVKARSASTRGTY
jgi:hypothetical protein